MPVQNTKHKIAMNGVRDPTRIGFGLFLEF